MKNQSRCEVSLALLLSLTTCVGDGRGSSGAMPQSLQAEGVVTDIQTNTVIADALADIPLQTTDPATNSGTDG